MLKLLLMMMSVVVVMSRCGATSPGEKCGKTTCATGMVCCNVSCGICAPPDGVCTQQFCE